MHWLFFQPTSLLPWDLHQQLYSWCCARVRCSPILTRSCNWQQSWTSKNHCWSISLIFNKNKYWNLQTLSIIHYLWNILLSLYDSASGRELNPNFYSITLIPSPEWFLHVFPRTVQNHKSSWVKNAIIHSIIATMVKYVLPAYSFWLRKLFTRHQMFGKKSILWFVNHKNNILWTTERGWKALLRRKLKRPYTHLLAWYLVLPISLHSHPERA